MEIEAAQSDAGVKIEPEESAAGQDGAFHPRNCDVASVANSNGNRGTFGYLFDGAGKRRVPAVVEDAIGDKAVRQFAELLVADEIA
jgi:hypothetical protein